MTNYVQVNGMEVVEFRHVLLEAALIQGLEIGFSALNVNNGITAAVLA